ncbi:MAG: hypothetical protein ACRDV9_07260 [Acidimicrobiia bacterium]
MGTAALTWFLLTLLATMVVVSHELARRRRVPARVLARIERPSRPRSEERYSDPWE